MTDLGPTIEFEIPGVAVGKSAPKFSRKSGRTYYPKKTTEWLAFVRDLAARVAPPEPWTCPVEVTIVVFRRPPESWSNKDRIAAITGEIYPTSRPDCDNYSKGICDGMEKGRIFRNDAQVVDLHVLKVYSDQEFTRVTVRAIGSAATQISL